MKDLEELVNEITNVVLDELTICLAIIFICSCVAGFTAGYIINASIHIVARSGALVLLIGL